MLSAPGKEAGQSENLWIRGQLNCSEDTLLTRERESPRGHWDLEGPQKDLLGDGATDTSRQAPLSPELGAAGIPTWVSPIPLDALGSIYAQQTVRNWASGRRKGSSRNRSPSQQRLPLLVRRHRVGREWSLITEPSKLAAGHLGHPFICSRAVLSQRAAADLSTVSLWQLRAGAACELAAVLTVVGDLAHTSRLLTCKAAEMLGFHAHAHNPGCLWVVLLILVYQSASHHP